MKRIEFRPWGAYAPSARDGMGGFLPVIETWCDGIKVHTTIGNAKDACRDVVTAATFAEARALGIIGELIHHYGDAFTFSVRNAPGRPRDPATTPPVELAFPTFLTREYREFKKHAFPWGVAQ